MGTKKKFTTDEYVEVVKCIIEGDFTYKLVTKDGVEEISLEHMGSDEELRDALQGDIMFQKNLEHLRDEP